MRDEEMPICFCPRFLQKPGPCLPGAKGSKEGSSGQQDQACCYANTCRGQLRGGSLRAAPQKRSLWPGQHRG
ncbi:hypothetical protein HHUSO_G2991 [Huso huso]|uniref:Uncharacterized protein n=1 Tax=Huso huso TaxID=61971 RepID=A0ABR1A8J4_HUSHU